MHTSVARSPSYYAATTTVYLFDKTITIQQRDIISNLKSLVPRTRNITLQILQLLHVKPTYMIRGLGVF